jgi:hypothetical protein
MKWRDATPEELGVVCDYLKSEAVTFEVKQDFRRYARRQAESDRLVQFQTGAALRMIAVEKQNDDVFDVVFFEPHQKLVMRLGSLGLRDMFEDFEELTDSVFLHAIKRHNRDQNREQEESQEGYGSF